MTNHSLPAVIITETTTLESVCGATDQRDVLSPGDRTWGIIYQPGGQRGQMSHYAADDRGAICLGGDSEWGDWIHGRLYTDDGDVYDDDGNPVTL